jgi:hypothetical protein
VTGDAAAAAAWRGLWRLLLAVAAVPVGARRLLRRQDRPLYVPADWT